MSEKKIIRENGFQQPEIKFILTGVFVLTACFYKTQQWLPHIKGGDL